MAAVIDVQRTSRRSVLVAIAFALALLASSLAVIASPARTAAAEPAQAQRKKIVIVVGPVGSVTAGWRTEARQLARQGRSYGARVVELYSPYATWSRVRDAAKGADMLIYFGHGNGWPSPYAPFQPYTKDGLGLNAVAGVSNLNVSYKGEFYMRQHLDLAPGAIVLLVHLCYASGNPEWGGPIPTLATAKARVDNYANGFLRAGARAVIAQGLGRAGYVLQGLFRTNKTLRQVFFSAPNASGRHTVRYEPRRSPWWAKAVLDPSSPGWYYRSAVGKLWTRSSAWR